MRVHFGLSKYIKLSTLLKIGLAILALFGFNKYVAHAQSFDTVQNWSYCSYNASTYNASGCNVQNSSYISTNTINNIPVIKITTARFTSLGYDGLDKHTEFYKYGGTSDCSTGNTISLYVDIVMDDINGNLLDNALDYSSWSNPTPTLRSGTRTTNINNYYYNWLSNADGTSTDNKVGVYVMKSDGTSSSQCSFVSYGSIKSLRYLCSVASGNTGYQIKINNYNANNVYRTTLRSQGATFVTAVRTIILNDPCTTEPNNNQGVIDSINGQTEGIINGIGGIIDNQNSNANQAHQDSLDEQDKLDQINDSINRFNNNVMSNQNSTAYLDTSFFGMNNKLTAMVNIPLLFIRAIHTAIDNEVCVSPSIDFSSITRRWNNDFIGGANNDYVLTFPCMKNKISSLVGTDFYNLCDYLLCAILVYNFGLHIFRKFDSITSLDSDAISASAGLFNKEKEKKE